MIFLIFLFFIILLLIFVLVVFYDHVFVGKTPFISLPKTTINEIIDKIEIGYNETFFDLGCGDGRVLILAAKKQPKAKYIGIEKAILPFVLAKLKTTKYPNIDIHLADVRVTDLSQATTVFIYLLPELAGKIRFSNQRVISVEYQIPKSKFKKCIKLTKTKLVSKFYIY